MPAVRERCTHAKFINDRSFIDVDGLRLSYISAGPAHPAPVLLLLPGLGRGADLYARLLPGLARGFRVLAVDNRGAGHSDAPEGPYTVAQLAEDARALLDTLSVERAHVLGCSLGGMLALELAASHPERVARLVLLSTTPGGQLAVPLSPETWQRLLAPRGRNAAEQLLDKMRLALAPEFCARRPRALAARVARRLALQPPAHAWLAQATAGAQFAIGDRLAGIAAPTLLLSGDRDRIVPLENSRRLAARLPDARLRVFRGAGHYLTLERPRAVLRATVEFLEEDPCAR